MEHTKCSQYADRLNKIARMSSEAGTISDEFIQYSNIYIPIAPFKELLADLLKKDAWEEKFSSDHIERRLLGMVASLCEGTSLSDVTATFKKLADEIQTFNTRYHVFFPMEGIQLPNGPVKIGQITLEKIDESQCDQFCSHLGDDAANEFIPIFKQRLAQSIKNRVCGRFSAVAEEPRTRELGEIELGRVLEFLRFATTLEDPWRHVGFGMLGEVPRGQRMVPAIDFEGSHFTALQEAAGSFVDLILNERVIREMEKIGLVEMSEVLSKPDKDLTDFERCLITGVRWCSIARNQIEGEGEFLGLVSAIETFLTPKDGSPISSSIAEAVAMILGKDFEARKKLKKRMRDLYTVRGKLTHGERTSLMDEDVKTLRIIAITLTSWMIQKKSQFDTKQALLDWLEEQRLR